MFLQSARSLLFRRECPSHQQSEVSPRYSTVIRICVNIDVVAGMFEVGHVET